jgi:hypothetical protein
MTSKQEKIRFWKTHNLKYYIKKQRFIGNAFPDDFFKDIFEWLDSSDVDSYLKQIQKLSVPFVYEKATDYQAKKYKNYLLTNSDDDIKDDYLFSNGYKIVKIITKDAMNKESKNMKNCLHGIDVDDGESFYSLRDAFNRSHVTINVVSNEILQIKGKANSMVRNRYFLMIREWISFRQLYVSDSNNFYYLNAVRVGNEIVHISELCNYDSVTIPHGVQFSKIKKPVILPNKMVINGDATFYDLGPDFIFPEELIVYGTLVLTNCRDCFFPKSIIAVNGVNIENCVFRKELPKIICNYITIENALEGLKDFQLDIKSPDVRILDESISVIDISKYFGKLQLVSCRSLVEIKGNNICVNTLDITECSNLKKIPEKMNINKLIFKDMTINKEIFSNYDIGRINFVRFINCNLTLAEFDIRGSIGLLELNGCNVINLKLDSLLQLAELQITRCPNFLMLICNNKLDMCNLESLDQLHSVVINSKSLFIKCCPAVILVENVATHVFMLDIMESNISDIVVASDLNKLIIRDSVIENCVPPLCSNMVDIHQNYEINKKNINMTKCKEVGIRDDVITVINDIINCTERVVIVSKSLKKIQGIKTNNCDLNNCSYLEEIGTDVKINTLFLSRKQNLNLILATSLLLYNKKIGHIKYE